MEELVVQGAVMLGMGVVGLIGLGINRLVKGAPERSPPLRRLADARDGEFIAVIGRVVSAASLRAPITGRACVCFDAAVWVQFEDHRELRDRQLRGAPFVIDDGSGQALVDPRGAFVRLDADRRRDVAAGDLSATDDTAFAPGRDLRDRALEEAVLAPGDQVVVHGLVRDGGGASDDILYRAADAPQRHLGGGPKRSALVSTLAADLPDR